MKDLFGSDDEDEDSPKDIIDKTKDLTAKWNNFGIETNQIKEEQKKEEPKIKPKKNFFDDIDEEKDKNKKKEKNEKPKELENKIEKNENKINIFNNENNNSNNHQPPKSKRAIFEDEDNEVEQKIEEKPKIEVKNPPSFLDSLKGKLAQRNQALNKKEAPKREEPKKGRTKKRRN